MLMVAMVVQPASRYFRRLLLGRVTQPDSATPRLLEDKGGQPLMDLIDGAEKRRHLSACAAQQKQPLYLTWLENMLARKACKHG